MDQAKKELLEQAGIAVDDVLARFMNNEALMLKFLLKFLADGSFAALQQALAQQDAAAAYDAAHTLKGVAGNLSMTTLFELASTMTDALRGGDLAAAAAQMDALTACYHRITQALAAL